MGRVRITCWILLLQSLSVFAEDENDVIIQAPDVTPFGRWGRMENCSQGLFVTAFQVKVNTFSSY